ncbi:MAG: cytidylate kinase-like family protein [Armatimonadota bacterium]
MIITISRQAGTNGSLIGRLVAERLGMRFFDRELTDELARRLQVEKEVITHFDESSLNPVESILYEWRTSTNEETYHRFLQDAFARIAATGDAVIIGRGANLALHGPETFHVRLIGPEELRVVIYREQHGLSSTAEAERELRHADRRRARFVRQHFRREIDDPLAYDLVINIGRMTPDDVTELIAGAVSRRVQQGEPSPEAVLPRHIEIMARHRRPAQPGVVEKKNRGNIGT